MNQEATTPTTPPSLHRTLITIAWPVVALNMLQVVNSLLDRLFIGSLPSAALTAHGASMSVLFLLFSLCISIAVGVGAIVSRAYGAKEVSEYQMASQQSFGISLYVGIALGVLGILAAPLVSRAILPVQDKESIKLMGEFLTTFSIGVPATCVIQTIASSLRSIGDTKSPMYISGVQILLHILLNYLLIFPSHGWLPGAGLGLPGAGLAYTISAYMVMIPYMLYMKRTPLQTRFSLAFPKKDWFFRVLRISVPSAFQAALRTFSLTAFTLILSLLANHDAALAALTTGFAIESLMFAPAFGLSAAVGALVGQSLGAREPQRAQNIGWLGALYALVIAFVVSAPVFLFVPYFAPILVGHKMEISAEVISVVRYLCVTEPLFCVSMVLIGAMQGAGDTKSPLWIGALSLWGLRVPMAMIFALESGHILFGGIALPWGLHMGTTGAWLALSVTQAIQGVFAALSWRAGRWKDTIV